METMTDEPNKTERKLTRTGSEQTLQGVVGETDADDIDIFGYQMIYTTGEFVVDRDALLQKCEEFGIASWMLPSETKAYQAFGRMIDDLLEGREEIEWEGQRVQFDLRQNDSRYSYTLDASVYYPPDMTDGSEGRWMAVENSDGEQGLGVLRYDSDSGTIRFVDRIDEDMSLFPVWADDSVGFKARARDLFDEHQESHTGKDVNNMTYYLVDQWTDSIRLRDACYFVPASHTYRVDTEERPIEDLIEAFRQLYDWLDLQAFDGSSDVVRKPSGAQHTEMHVVEIMDTDRQRQMVEQKVEQKLGDMAESLFDEITDGLQEDDSTVDNVAKEVSDTLTEIDAVSDEYGTMLKVQQSVRRAMREALEGLGDDAEEQVRSVLDEVEGAPSLDD